MQAITLPNYLAGYPPELVAQVQRLIEQDRLGDWLLQKYPAAHKVRTDRALYDYTQEIKEEHLRNTGQLSKALFDNKLHVIHNALGTHTSISRVQGAKLKSKREIRVAIIFREMPPEFLRMIVVHELAHLKERKHDKPFYQLCRHIEPDYHQLEFDLRTYLSYLAVTGNRLWGTGQDIDETRTAL
jgi:UTP pyrophosphatase